MSVKVRIHPLLREFTGGQEVVEVAGMNIGECLENLGIRFPGIKQRLCDKQGQVLGHLQININSEDSYQGDPWASQGAGLARTVNDGDELIIVAIVAGGWKISGNSPGDARSKMRKLSEIIVLIKGGGEVASGVAHRLYRSHLRVCLTEIANPLAVSHGVTFCEAVFDDEKTIEGVTAELVSASAGEIQRVWREGNIAIVVDPEALVRERLKPDVLVDATMAKCNTGVKSGDAPLVIGLGPGFCAGRDVHIVVETNHSSNLGRVILEGEAEEDTGDPVAVGGFTRERVVWAPHPGIFVTEKEMGDSVVGGEVIGQIGGRPLESPMNGILRGLMRNGVSVPKGAKLIEVDPVHDKAICDLITDKMGVIGEGFLKAIKLRSSIKSNF